MRPETLAIPFFLFFSFQNLCNVQTKNDSSGESNLINKLSWLEGTWQGNAFDGFGEEIWSAPKGNNIIGMFRHLKDGEIVFTEINYIVEENDMLILKLKHFDKNLVGWEEKEKFIDFPQIKVEDKAVYFEGMSYKLMDAGRLRATVKTTGKTKEVKVFYTRKY
ncbi:MAG: DUF6265 family protein [Bacteroidota bacterium]